MLRLVADYLFLLRLAEEGVYEL